MEKWEQLFSQEASQPNIKKEHTCTRIRMHVHVCACTHTHTHTHTQELDTLVKTEDTSEAAG